MPIDFYYSLASPPCRSVLLVAKALNVKLNLIETDTMKGDHLKPEFIKLNPQHTIPTLVDNGTSIWESRAIVTFLLNKYGRGSDLYPEEPETRAVVDQRLYFDFGLNEKFNAYVYPQWIYGAPADDEKLKTLEQTLDFLETFLTRHQFVAGDKRTVADICVLSTVSNLGLCGIDVTKWAKINAWYDTMKKTTPGFKEYIEAGVTEMIAIIESLKKK